MNPDVRRILTCWPPIAFVETTIGRLAIFALSARAACEMKAELQDQVLSESIAETDFARVAVRYICFPDTKLRDGRFRPTEIVLSEKQCGHLSEGDLCSIAGVFMKGEDPTAAATSNPLSLLISDFSNRWHAENERQAAELRRSFDLLGKRLEILVTDGVDVDRLPANELVRLLRKPEALKSYERFCDMATFAKQGWFVDSHMPIRFWREAAAVLRDLEEESEHEDRAPVLDEFQSIINGHYESRYPQIKVEILSRFRNRSHILEPAFSAHEQGLYCLSIPVFIAQADGIFKESRGFGLFCKDGLNQDTTFKELRDAIEKGIRDLHEISWTDLLPLLFHSRVEGVIPFKTRTTDSEAGTCESFNRHAIMHGLCTFYASKENSLRYISLLCYLSWALDERE